MKIKDRRLKWCEKVENKFTVVLAVPDLYANYGDESMPEMNYYYFRFNNEKELRNVITDDIKKADLETHISVQDIENIYFGHEDVTNRYILKGIDENKRNNWKVLKAFNLPLTNRNRVSEYRVVRNE